jgi:hypothetical protein
VIGTREYLDFLQSEYLADFVARGGAAVKFLVPQDDPQADVLHAGLENAAARTNFVYVQVDAAMDRVHMIDQVFFAVARQVDWEGLTNTFLRQVYVDCSFPVPDTSYDLTVATLARAYDYDQGELNRTINRHLQQSLLSDFQMAQEFRVAMVRLCQSRMLDNSAATAEREAVLEWLRGDLRQIARLRSALIFRRIARHNARHMLFSLARWVVRNGYAGMLIDLDIRRCTVAKRGGGSMAGDVYYTKAAVMDAYEVLRQLIDATDELSACCVTVTASPEFLSDDTRGLSAYTALQLRIWDDVRDRTRTNPLSALVRLGAPT